MTAGDRFPSGVVFSYIPESSCDGVTCGKPVDYNASEEFDNKRIVLVSVPGAFTPTCSERHLPGYIKLMDKFQSLGVSKILVMAYNDAYVMRAWKKQNGVTGDFMACISEIFRLDLKADFCVKEFVCDSGTAFAKQLGWMKGERTARFAMVIDSGKILYAERETGSEVGVSSADEVLKFLEQS